MTFNRILSMARPWLIFIAVLALAKYTGVISAVSSATQQALMKTGAMDASTEESTIDRKFNYNFTLRDIDRNEINVESLKGKTIFINVWATWCGPCRVEMPSIQTLFEQVDPDKVAFIMLAVDQKDAQNRVSSYIKEKGFTFPVYFPNGHLPEQLQVRSIPATFVINGEGRIVYREMGAANYATEEFRRFLMTQ